MKRSLLVAVFASFWLSASHGGVVLSTSYTRAEGFRNAPLRNNPDWVGGGQVAVRPGTTGFVRNGNLSSNDPTYNVNGVLGTGTGTGFRIGDRLTIQTQTQLTIGGPFAVEMQRFGFARSTESSPQLEFGFGVVYDVGLNQPLEEQGNIRFFPDFNDYVLVDRIAPVNVANSFSLQGRFLGLRPDRRLTHPLEIDYSAEKIAVDEWQVIDLTIRDTVSKRTYFYDDSVQPVQTFKFDGDNAFFGQRMVVQGRSSSQWIARSEFVTVTYAPVPEPGSPFALLLMCGGATRLLSRRRR